MAQYLAVALGIQPSYTTISYISAGVRLGMIVY